MIKSTVILKYQFPNYQITKLPNWYSWLEFWNPILKSFMEGYHQYKLCIDACLTCAALCNHCAASCLKEEDPAMMKACIQLSMECAAVCYATAQLMSLNSDKVKEFAKLCAVICDTCAEECNKHMSDHCHECAEACTKCADECEII